MGIRKSLTFASGYTAYTCVSRRLHHWLQVCLIVHCVYWLYVCVFCVSMYCLYVNCSCTVWSMLSRISLTKAHVLWWCDNKSDLIWFRKHAYLECKVRSKHLPNAFVFKNESHNQNIYIYIYIHIHYIYIYIYIFPFLKYRIFNATGWQETMPGSHKSINGITNLCMFLIECVCAGRGSNLWRFSQI